MVSIKLATSAPRKGPAKLKADVIADSIRRRIILGELRDGNFLPKEAELVEAFGVSRQAMREALRILENEQFISVGKGARFGARVHAPPLRSVARYAGFALQSHNARLADLYEARLGIEPFAASKLAKDRRPESLLRLRLCLEDYGPVIERGDSQASRQVSARFHRAVVGETRNVVMIMMIGILYELIERHQAHQPHSDFPRSVIEKGWRSETHLLSLIEKGDEAEAEQHWRAHLRYSNERWMSREEPDAALDLIGDQGS